MEDKFVIHKYTVNGVDFKSLAEAENYIKERISKESKEELLFKDNEPYSVYSLNNDGYIRYKRVNFQR